VSQRLLIVTSAAIATVGALVLNLSNFADFLFLLGSFFVPLLGVLLADWFVDGMHYTREKVFDGPAVRPEMIVAWLVGFGLYQWLSPQGPGWWTSLVGHTHPAPIDFTASLPSFAASFMLAGLSAVVMKNRRQAEAFAET
jgi:purine-cytosine permease-like protein